MFKKTICIFSIFLVLIALPLLSARAQLTPPGGGEITNPVGDTFEGIIGNIIDWVANIGILIAVIMIIYSGYLFMTSGGSDEKVAKAKKALIWSLIGLAVLIMGKNFISLIKDILG